MPQMSKAEVREELESTQDLIRKITGQTCRLFRPPYGALTETVLDAADDLELTTVLWSVSSGDWLCPGADAIVERVSERLRPGAVVLFHDGCGDYLRPDEMSAARISAGREQTADAVPDIIGRARKMGLTFPSLRADP
jgi:chitooligosaccharide deacetylase